VPVSERPSSSTDVERRRLSAGASAARGTAAVAAHRRLAAAAASQCSGTDVDPAADLLATYRTQFRREPRQRTSHAERGSRLEDLWDRRAAAAAAESFLAIIVDHGRHEKARLRIVFWLDWWPACIAKRHGGKARRRNRIGLLRLSSCVLLHHSAGVIVVRQGLRRRSCGIDRHDRDAQTDRGLIFRRRSLAARNARERGCNERRTTREDRALRSVCLVPAQLLTSRDRKDRSEASVSDPHRQNSSLSSLRPSSPPEGSRSRDTASVVLAERPHRLRRRRRHLRRMERRRPASATPSDMHAAADHHSSFHTPRSRAQQRRTSRDAKGQPLVHACFDRRPRSSLVALSLALSLSTTFWERS
jgi:hypothetical protein